LLYKSYNFKHPVRNRALAYSFAPQLRKNII